LVAAPFTGAWRWHEACDYRRKPKGIRVCTPAMTTKIQMLRDMPAKPFEGRPPLGACPVETAINVMGGKWKPLILFYLLDGTKRFNALQRLMPQTTRRMLTQHLRELERDGIVHREVYREVPPKVEYSLTPLGRSMEPILAQMLAWGQQYLRERAAE
jgi:DNA-binding HxlR family transcriptional regulator